MSNKEDVDIREELKSNFLFMGQTPSDNVLDKTIELCKMYRLKAEEIVDQWSAFSISHLKSASVSIEGILLMERKELAKAKKHSPIIDVHSNEISTEEPTQGMPLKRPSSFKNKNLHQQHNLHGDSLNSSQTSVTSSQKDSRNEYIQASYVDRSDAGEVKVSFGNDIQYSRQSQDVIPVKLLYNQIEWYTDRFMYLHTSCGRIAQVFDYMVETIGKSIIEKNKLEAPQSFTKLSVCGGNVIGRIKPIDNRLSSKNVILEGTGTNVVNKGKEIILDISKTSSYSLFPGQVVAVTGVNMIGSPFDAQKFYIDASTDFTQETPKLTGNMQIVLGAGPYTLCNNMLYEPLQDLLKYVVEHKPDVCILMGPFLDEGHVNIEDMTESYDSYFESLIDTIMSCLKDLPTKVVLMSSYKDISFHRVYPTPVYDLKQKYSNLLCAPDPCMLNINGFIVGGTTIDILFDLTKEEISRNPQNDRITRLASHIVSQRNFYPLYPSKTASIDHETLLNHCMMDVVPHILILPSVLQYCIKNVNDCLVVNPGHLSKNYVGGTFAVINVSPCDKSGSMINNISCQIKKI